MTIEANITTGDSMFMLGRQATDKVACPTDGQLRTELNYRGLIIEPSTDYHRFVGIEDTTANGGETGGVIEVCNDQLESMISFEGDIMDRKPVMTGDKGNRMGIQLAIRRGGTVVMEVSAILEDVKEVEIETIVEFKHKE